jgi:acetyl-CoA acetyltransferase
MHGKPLTPEAYDSARWIVEPFRLYDCCMENDGAAALILVAADRARDFARPPVYLLGAASGAESRAGAIPHNAPVYASANSHSISGDLYEMARVGPSDVGSVQAYENFTGGVVMSLCEHGFFKPDEINDFMTLENLCAPSGKLPLNTSGGNLGEVYLQGFQLVIEAARQVRGESTSQARNGDIALVTGGPMVSPASSLIFGSEATL